MLSRLEAQKVGFRGDKSVRRRDIDRQITPSNPIRTDLPMPLRDCWIADNRNSLEVMTFRTDAIAGPGQTEVINTPRFITNSLIQRRCHTQIKCIQATRSGNRNMELLVIPAARASTHARSRTIIKRCDGPAISSFSRDGGRTTDRCGCAITENTGARSTMAKAIAQDIGRAGTNLEILAIPRINSKKIKFNCCGRTIQVKVFTDCLCCIATKK